MAPKLAAAARGRGRGVAKAAGKARGRGAPGPPPMKAAAKAKAKSGLAAGALPKPPRLPAGNEAAALLGHTWPGGERPWVTAGWDAGSFDRLVASFRIGAHLEFMAEVQEEARGLCVVEVTGFLAVPEGMVVSGRFQGCEEDSLVEYLQGHLDSGQLRLLLSRDHGVDGDMLQQGLLRVQRWRNRAGTSFSEAWIAPGLRTVPLRPGKAAAPRLALAPPPLKALPRGQAAVAKAKAQPLPTLLPPASGWPPAALAAPPGPGGMGAVALLSGKYGFPPNPLSGVPSAKAGMRALPPIGAADLGAEVDELPNSPPGISKSKGDEKDKKKRNKKKKKKVKAKDVINVYLWKRSHKGDESDRAPCRTPGAATRWLPSAASIAWRTPSST